VGNFSQNVNKGLKSLCEKAKTQKITVYWLRHTWATVALNKCGASIEQVAFCLNHSSAHKITETGEGVIRDRTEFRISEGKIQSKGCNCVSVRELNNGEDSKQIEEDLLAANTEAYEPEGCNIKKGG
jgi:hypothetical protein